MTKGCPTVHIIWSVPPSDEAEVDAWVTEHEAFMQATHSFGAGDEPCMLKYYISKGPEKSNPMDPTSEPTGNFVYVISETYKTAEGIPGHMAAAGPWKDGAMLGKLMELHGKFGVFMEVGGGVFTNIADDETVSVTTKGEPCIHVVQNVPKADEAVMDAYWKDHEAFMRTTHVKGGSGDDADAPRVTSFSINKAIVLASPLDPESGDTGFISYVMSETYVSPSGIANHFVKAPEHWTGFAELPAKNEKYLLTIEVGTQVVANMGEKMK